MPNRNRILLFVLTLSNAMVSITSGQSGGPARVSFRPASGPAPELALPAIPPDPAVATGTMVQIKGTNIDGELVIHWQPGDLPGGVDAREMQVVEWRGDQWHAVPGAKRAGDSISVPIHEPGTWSLRWTAGSSTCSSDADHALDFRLGLWAYRAVGYTPGTSRLTRDPSGCAFADQYVDERGGRSASFYRRDPKSGDWINTTIDPGGRSVSRGTAAPGEIIFTISPLEREVYRRASDSTVLFSGEKRATAAAAWVPWATATYTRKNQ